MVLELEQRAAAGNCIPREVLLVLPPSLGKVMEGAPAAIGKQLEEIRLRLGKPLMLQLALEALYLTGTGQPTSDPQQAYQVTAEDIRRVLELLSHSSIYALEEEFRHGFLTLQGGHRVGFVGEAVLERGKVRTLKNIGGLNLRVAREVTGCSSQVLPWLVQAGRVYHTLVLSPPRCGKTTFLRDLVRQFSNGIPKLNFAGVNVGVVDERSEIAGCWHGICQRDVGLRTDVLDRCPKAEGIQMLVRSMAPQVIATDELGRENDVAAVEEVLSAGISLLATVHGSRLEELRHRPTLSRLLDLGAVERVVLLSRSRGPGTVEAVIDPASGRRLLVDSALRGRSCSGVQADGSDPGCSSQWPGRTGRVQ